MAAASASTSTANGITKAFADVTNKGLLRRYESLMAKSLLTDVKDPIGNFVPSTKRFSPSSSDRLKALKENKLTVSHERLELEIKNRPVVLYIIDQQNDFVTGGSFAVAEGLEITNGIVSLIDYLESVTKESGQKFYIRASRDYHPGINGFDKIDADKLSTMGQQTREGAMKYAHCSFLSCGDPAFPRHCEQGENGTYIVSQLRDKLKSMDGSSSADIKILFKGVDPSVESFGAVPPSDIDYARSRQAHKCSTESVVYDDEELKERMGGFILHNPDGSELTSSYSIDWNEKSIMELEAGSAIDGKTKPRWIAGKTPYNFVDGKILMKPSKEVFIPDEDAVYIVVGLAGDFCVKDTSLALAGYGVTVRVLNEGTRYAILPDAFTPVTAKWHRPTSFATGIPVQMTADGSKLQDYDSFANGYFITHPRSIVNSYNCDLKLVIDYESAGIEMKSSMSGGGDSLFARYYSKCH